MSDRPVTAIDIALKPDAAMVRRARADNARLLKAYPGGFALDATHHPHMTMIQRFVRTADLAKVHDGLVERFYSGCPDHILSAEPGRGAVHS